MSAHPTVAVLGAGLSGLRCAQLLVEAGCAVQVFDKARGTGGRMSTRRGDEVAFDHGAQYFTARSAPFQAEVKRWRAQGIVSPWLGRIGVIENGTHRPVDNEDSRYVGVPTMNALAKNIAREADIAVQHGFHAQTLEPSPNTAYRLYAEDDQDAGPFDWVVSSAPAPQTIALLDSVSQELTATAASTVFAPCLAAMVQFGSPVDLQLDGAFVERSALSWVARNNSKPGRPAAEAWVLHGSPDWSRDHFEDNRDTVATALLDAFRADAGIRLPDVHTLQAHRWAYSLPTTTVDAPYLIDTAARVAACGDWCGGPRVEGAWHSGNELAQRILKETT